MFLFRLLLENSIDSAESISFQSFLSLFKIQKLISVLEGRQISPGRIYALVLTLIKVLNFIAFYCTKKQMPISATSFATWNLLLSASRMFKVSEKSRVFSRQVTGFASRKNLEKGEMIKLLPICLKWLQERIRSLLSSQDQTITKKSRKEYLAHFITAFLISVPTPRVQILAKLEENKTFFFDGSVYYFLFDGLNPPLKSKKPLFLTVPDHLTEALKIWMSHFRPLCSPSLIFPSASGKKPRRDWSSLTGSITLRYLNKRVPPGKFRLVLLLVIYFVGTRLPLH